MFDPLAGLNDKQREAALVTDGPVLILAGAGSGKTRTLTHRIANLLVNRIARPDQVMAVTFTNKAAREMKERLAVILGGSDRLPYAIGTFHSLGARMLREQHALINRTARFTILDAQDSERLVRQILNEMGLSPRQWSPRSIKQAISRAKNDGLSPEAMAAQARGQAGEIAAEVSKKYDMRLAKHDSFDFDDLILEPLKLLTASPEVRRQYQARWRYLSVDEYQDTNQVQDALLRLLLSEDRNLCAVGDDYQAIYSWRGAKVDHILRFEESFPGCQVVYLTQNYRSTGAILHAANEVIKDNHGQKHKKLWTEADSGMAVQLVTLPSDKQEAAWVRQQVRDRLDEGGSPADIAILYRTNAQSRLLEEELLRHRVPYMIVGGVKFYDRAEIKDALALLQLLANPRAVLSFQRIVKNLVAGVGPKTMQKIITTAEQADEGIWQAITRAGTVTDRQRAALEPWRRAFEEAALRTFSSVKDALTTLLNQTGYIGRLKSQPDGEERMENIDQLLTVAAGYTDIVAFMEEVALLTDLDAPEQTGGKNTAKVTCMTLHAAKGLEFKRVYLVGCEEDLLPHISCSLDAAALEEERRLLYVGMTRAQEKLVLTNAQQRATHGELLWRQPSRFLESLPVEVERWDANGFSPSQPAVSGEPVYTVYEVGDQFRHPIFGAGVVVDTKGSTITCVFEGHGLKQIDAQI